MLEKYVRLRAGWMLRGWTDDPFVLANSNTGKMSKLAAHSFYVAEACDGQTNFNSIAFLPPHHAVLDKLIAEGMAELCTQGNVIEPYQRYRKAENPMLKSVHWNITGLCNLHCRHCYMEAPTGRYGELPFPAIVALIEQFERANVLEVALAGGEPFVRKDLFAIMELLVQKKIGISQIYSNGMLITDEYLKTIRDMGVLPEFFISFDGCGAHDQIRGMQGSELQVIQAIKRLRASGFRVSVNTMIDKTNKNCLDTTYDLLKTLDIEAWRIGLPTELGNWRGSATALSLDEAIEPLAQLQQHWFKDGKPFLLKLSSFFLGVQKLSTAITDNEHTPESYDCAACRERASLQPDGTLVTCPLYVDTVFHKQMPNLLREELSQVWNKSLLRTMADRKKKDLLAQNPDCGICELFNKCGMGCRASAIKEKQDSLASDPVACALWKGGLINRFREVACIKA